MAKLALVHPQETFQVSARLLVQKCDLFCNDLSLLVSPYNLKSLVPLSDFHDFVSALDGAEIAINNNNFRALSRLCEEFGFAEFSARVSEFRNSSEFKEIPMLEDSEVRVLLSALEVRIRQFETQMSAQQTELSQQFRSQESAMEGLVGRVAQLEADNALRTPFNPPACTSDETTHSRRSHRICLFFCFVVGICFSWFWAKLCA
jgi:hypothetical protein